MSPIKLILLTCLVLFLSNSVYPDLLVMKEPGEYVKETERRFAETMELRDFEGFKSYLSEEAVFFSGSRVLRGKQEVARRRQLVSMYVSGLPFVQPVTPGMKP